MTTMYFDRVIPLKQLKIISDKFAIDIVDASHKAQGNEISYSNAARSIETALQTIKENWKLYTSTKIEGDEKILADEVKKMISPLEDKMNELKDLLNKNDTLNLQKFRETQLYPAVDPMTGKINELIDLQLKISEEINTSSDVLYSETRSYSYLILISGIFISLILAIYIIWSINSSIKKANYAITKMAKGDLTIEIDSNSKDEIGVMMSNLQIMIEKLRETILGIRQASENIASASQQLSQGSTEQASSTEEVSSSMEEIASNIQQTTDNAQQTEKIAVKASTDIMEGSKAVNQTVESMKIIAEKISIIGEIARKTDLLAINAAVEAARAGDQGRGFAVVAAEVRKLAEHTQIAAKEINEVSKSSVSNAIKSGALLTEIVPNIEKTARLVQEITASSMEQNSGTGQINNAIQQLNQVTQENAAAAEELSSQAEQLLENVEFFNVGAMDYKMKSNMNKIKVQHLTSSLKNKNSSKGFDLNLNDDRKIEKDFERF